MICIFQAQKRKRRSKRNARPQVRLSVYVCEGWLLIPSAYALLSESVVASQSRPDVIPFPVSAEQPKICHVRSRNDERFKASDSSEADMLPRTSCLFAHTKIGARSRFSSAAMRCNSARASETRSRSLLSTTKINL